MKNFYVLILNPHLNHPIMTAGRAFAMKYLGLIGYDCIHEHETMIRLIPHARTLRKARIQVQQMVSTGLSTKRIRRYLHQFLLWWVKTIDSWTYQELVIWFVEACWDIYPVAHASALLQGYFNKLGLSISRLAHIAA